MKKHLLLPAIVLLSFQFSSCGLVQTVAVKSTAGIIDYGMAAIFEESDLQLAESAIPGNMVLIEALHKADPGNEKLSLLLVQGYTGYALGFVEDQDPQRAIALYERARNYGLDVLRRRTDFDKNFEESPEKFIAGVNALSEDDVPLLFWTANAWGNLINLNMSDPATVVDLYKVNAMMDFVMRHDSTFFYGSTHLYFGTILATTPRVLGGNPVKAREHFEMALAMGQRKFLLPFFYYAKSYAVQVQDQELFESLLKEVTDAPIDILPEQRLVNAIAKKKAKLLLAKEADLF
jgi:hypothetical protein